MANAGFSQTVIHWVIQTLRDRFINTGTVEAARRSGHLRITNVQRDRYAKLLVLREPPARSGTSASSKQQVSEQTIRSGSHEGNLHSRRPVVTPPPYTSPWRCLSCLISTSSGIDLPAIVRAALYR